MTEGHLSEKEIQEYILSGGQGETPVRQHMQTCAQCSGKAATYSSLFTVINEAPVLSFDFDVETLIMPQLVTQEKRKPWKMPALLGITVIPFTILAWFTGKFMLNELAGQSVMVVFLVVITAVFVLTLHLMDMFKKYREQMRTYNFENSLQQ